MSFLSRTDILKVDIGATTIDNKVTRYKFIDEDMESINQSPIEIIAVAMDDYVLRVILTDYNHYLLPSLLSYLPHKILNIDFSELSEEIVKSLVNTYSSAYIADGNLHLVIE